MRQEDSLSCLLFNMTIESLARPLFQSVVITGFTALNGMMSKKKLYADDTAVYLSDFREWNTVLKIYDLYSRASGAKLNKSKTIIMATGLIALLPFYFKDIKVEWRTPVTYLDIFIKVDIDYFQLWHKILQDFHTIIRNWFKYYLFIKQKILMNKMALNSKLWFYIRCLSITNEQLNAFDQVVKRYIWTTSEGRNAVAPITAEQTKRSLDESKLKMQNLRIMKKVLNIWWIQHLKKYSCFRYDSIIWPYLMRNIFLYDIIDNHSLVQMPWSQIWCFKFKKPSSSVSHFWKWYVKIKNYRDFITRSEVEKLIFWYHLALTKERTSPRWDERVWNNLYLKKGLERLVIYVDEIWVIAQEFINASSYMKRTAQRVSKLFPVIWTNLLSIIFTDDSMIRFPHYFIANKSKFQSISTSCTMMYYFLLQNVYVSKELVKRYREECRQTSNQINRLIDKQFWRDLNDKSIDYLKFSDLMWKLAHGCIRTKKTWMKSAFCSLYNVLQSSRHLF